MKLRSLIEGAGKSLSDVASATKLRPLLLQRIDQGIQPVTPSIAVAIAFAIGVDVPTVKSCCPLKTNLDGPRFRVPFPVQPGEPQEVSRLAPAKLAAPNPAGFEVKSIAVFLAHTTNAIDGSAIGEQWLVAGDGRTLVHGGVLIDNQVGEGHARGIGFGLYGEPNVLWLGGDTDGFQVVRFRVDPATFALLGDPNNTSIAFSGQAAMAAKDPATGTVWFTAGNNELYYWQQGSSSPGTASFSALAPFDSLHKYRCLWFGPDGYLYALLVRTSGALTHGVARIDPSIVSPSMLAAPASLYTTTSVRPIEFVPAAGKLFVTDPANAGTNTLLVEWNPSTLTFTTHTVTNRLLFTGAYDPATDRLIYGGGNTTLTQWGPTRVSRAGAIDWVSGTMTPGVTAGICTAAISPVTRRFAMCGVVAGKNTLGYYDADTGEELALVSIGTGPNPAGSNLPPVGMMFT